MPGDNPKMVNIHNCLITSKLSSVRVRLQAVSCHSCRPPGPIIGVANWPVRTSRFSVTPAQPREGVCKTRKRNASHLLT